MCRPYGTYGGGVGHVAHMGRNSACGTYEGGVGHVAHMGEE